MTDIVRGEFDMLQKSVTENMRRIEAIDQGGTRGVAVVQLQISDLAKDIARLDQRMTQHDKEHDLEIEERKATRRWRVGMVIGAIATLCGLYALLIDVIVRIH